MRSTRRYEKALEQHHTPECLERESNPRPSEHKAPYLSALTTRPTRPETICGPHRYIYIPRPDSPYCSRKVPFWPYFVVVSYVHFPKVPYLAYTLCTPCTSYTPPELWVRSTIDLPTHEVQAHEGGGQTRPELPCKQIGDGDLCVVLDVTKVVDAETAKAWNRTPDLRHRKHTFYH